MIVNRKLIIVWLLCFVLITMAIIVKLEDQKQNETVSVPDYLVENEQLTTSDSFYLEEDKSEEKKQVEEKKVTNNISPITAKAYIVANLESGNIILEKNARMRLPVASMSKLITAIEAIDKYSTSSEIVLNLESVKDIPDPYNFIDGDKFTVEDLLYPLLLNSSNIAAEIIASSTDRKDFMDNMSSYAWEIGMPDTYFADPSGISPYNASTAFDFFALARYLYKSRPDILDITKTAKMELATTTEHGYYQFTSIHPFVYNSTFIGGKTGHTKEAKDTMLSIFMVKNQPIAIIVLSSDDRRKDTSYLLGKVQGLI